MLVGPPLRGVFVRIVLRGYLWVDLFLLLSGFIICHVYGDRFTGRSVRESFGPYWFRIAGKDPSIRDAALARHTLSRSRESSPGLEVVSGGNLEENP
jgi:hypothetical protein